MINYVRAHFCVHNPILCGRSWVRSIKQFNIEKEAIAAMSEQEKPEAVATEEQPPVAEKESATTAADSEQKPDTGEGEKPSETPKESEPTSEEAPKEAEEAPKETEQAAEEEEEDPEEEEPDDGVPIVLVTGASGFIATHLIKQLLEQGRYHVRGTVRNRKKEEKV